MRRSRLHPAFALPEPTTTKLPDLCEDTMMTTLLKKNLHRLLVPVLLLGIGLLQGCGTAYVSKNLTDDGKAGEVVFPTIANSATLPEGTFPNIANLRAVGPGVTKDQLFNLFGAPHFKEGMYGVREWDYIFNFRSGGGVTTCQYKVIFDKDYTGQSFHWMPANCASMLDMPATNVPAVAAAATAPMKMQLSADALFAFDKSGINDLRAEGRNELDRIAGELNGTDIDKISIVGHTDRLGSNSYNQRLSQRRADTVAAYLKQKGVAAGGMSAMGRGESDPVVQCDQRSRNDLIACLAPNRRVEISVEAKKTAP